mgnify:CR=1 FL=1
MFLGEHQDWWTQVTDRAFFIKVYHKVGLYLTGKNDPCVLDVGTKRYNSVCKGLLNNPSVKYWQLEPEAEFHENNDGFYHCTIEECIEKYPNSESKFDVIIDTGVFGWNGVRFDQKEQSVYINNILKLLKPDGIYILHADRVEQDSEYIIYYEKTIYPFFEKADFMGYSAKEYLRCDTYGTEWDIRFLKKK